jgi:hypothetical protein
MKVKEWHQGILVQKPCHYKMGKSSEVTIPWSTTAEELPLKQAIAAYS